MTRNSLKKEAWPTGDKVMWQRAFTRRSVLDEGGSCADWASETRRVSARDYGYWLQFVLNFDPAMAAEPPVARLTRERVLAYCKSMESVSALTRACRIARLHTLVRAANPTVDLGWLAEIRRGLEKLARRTGPVRSKHNRVMATGRLINAGVKLLSDAHRDECNPMRKRAKDFRDGLMIALLAARPLRIKNFAGLRLGLHLRATATGYAIDIPGEETKTGRPIESFVPDDLVPWLSIYLSEYRPYLLHGRLSDHVWVHSAGGAYTPGSLSQRISKLTARNLGVAISPHLFRDCAATTIATDDPEHVHTIAPILGHSTIRIAENHYNHAHALEANRRLQASIQILRRVAQARAKRADHVPRLRPPLRQADGHS